MAIREEPKQSPIKSDLEKEELIGTTGGQISESLFQNESNATRNDKLPKVRMS